jgi:hypothetical protein
MANPEIIAIRAMLTQNPMKLATTELRAGYDKLSAAFPIPSDVKLQAENAYGAPAEWDSTPDAKVLRRYSFRSALPKSYWTTQFD